MTSEQLTELDAFINRLPPTLTHYKKHIRSLTIGFAQRNESSFWVLMSDEAVRQLECLQYDGLIDDAEYDARVEKGLSVDNFVVEGIPEIEFEEITDHSAFRAAQQDVKRNWNSNHLKRDDL